MRHLVREEHELSQEIEKVWTVGLEISDDIVGTERLNKSCSGKGPDVLKCFSKRFNSLFRDSYITLNEK